MLSQEQPPSHPDPPNPAKSHFNGGGPLLDRLGRIGWLQRISKHYYILPSVLIELVDHARAVAGAHPASLLTVGQFREATGIGRNITMPILEYFDAQGLTMRVPEGRRVRG